MAHIRKVKYKSTVSYNCIVKRVGFKTISRNFDTKIGAKKWARAIERKLDQGEVFDYTQASRLTLRGLLDRYINEINIDPKRVGAWKSTDRNILRKIRLQIVTV